MDELIRWRSSVREVSALLLDYPGRSENRWLRNFPHGSCSIVSYAVGRLLLERHLEQWLIESRSGYGQATHTWLVRDHTEGPPAEIDATVHQFPEIASAPFIGWGASPAREHFPTASTHPVHVGLIGDWWHHGGTEEVYQWLFPQLGLRSFERHSALRDLMPEEISYPPVARLADRLIDARETCYRETRYAFLMSWASSQTLLRNSDSAMDRGNKRHDEYREHYVIHHKDVDDDLVYLVPVAEGATEDAFTFVGVISSGQHQAIPLVEMVDFDPSALRAARP